MNIAKMFVFAALLVMAGGGGGGLAHGEDCHNAPHHGEPYGEIGEGKCAFGGKQVVQNPCEHKTDNADDAKVFHNGPHADASDPDAQVYHHGPTRG